MMVLLGSCQENHHGKWYSSWACDDGLVSLREASVTQMGQIDSNTHPIEFEEMSCLEVNIILFWVLQPPVSCM